MQIYVTLNLAADDEYTMTSQEAADAVLAALGADPTKDTCTVQATIPAAVAGYVAPLEPVTPA
jgi:hypothetical protein